MTEISEVQRHRDACKRRDEANWAAIARNTEPPAPPAASAEPTTDAERLADKLEDAYSVNSMLMNRLASAIRGEPNWVAEAQDALLIAGWSVEKQPLPTPAVVP